MSEWPARRSERIHPCVPFDAPCQPDACGPGFGLWRSKRPGNFIQRLVKPAFKAFAAEKAAAFAPRDETCPCPLEAGPAPWTRYRQRRRRARTGRRLVFGPFSKRRVKV